MKVFVALSGGVDSSVAAALLQRQGFAVCGVFIKIWEPDLGPCRWREERREAMRVAAQLKIPFQTVDLSQPYRQAVVDQLLSEYRQGRTPNPDVCCNQQIKFGALWSWAKQRGMDFFATGHYAQISKIDSRYYLTMAKDKTKDQTYFLWNLPPDRLAKTLFPIGAYQKSQVRQLARKFSLTTADKPDSQGLCFIGQTDLKTFLLKHLGEQAGVVENLAGQVIGRHQGAYLYTIGERHGFTVQARSDRQPPLYVVAKRLADNVLVVDERPAKTSGFSGSKQKKSTIRLDQVNWLSGQAPEDLERPYQARYRYRQVLQPGRLIYQLGHWFFRFDQAEAIYPSGQSLVIYDEDRCLGGGIITDNNLDNA